MRLYLLCLLILFNFQSYSSSKKKSELKKYKSSPALTKKNLDYVLHVKKATGAIKLDGKIDEQDWISAEKAKDFHLVLPVDTGDRKSVV